jgi:hypothetical protein
MFFLCWITNRIGKGSICKEGVADLLLMADVDPGFRADPQSNRFTASHFRSCPTNDPTSALPRQIGVTWQIAQ